MDPKSPLARLKRAADTQKCIRAGGKHNDLDDVGKDTYHHTFFEMLGNWSFGDYFKREAIDMAWELLTVVFKLPEDRLYATYFRGDEVLGLPADEEAKAIWLEKLPAHKVLPFGSKENFWEMGDTGPCGPCTEIHYDRVGGRDASALVNMDDPMCIEIWNNVFMQFNREPDRSLRPLPAKHVDTGMGFERLVSILQNKPSNYDTDVFAPLFSAIQAATGFPRPYGGKLGAEDEGNADMAYRVVADHIRTLSFAIADGAQPGPEGRNYVLRRILRRAVRYGRDCLGAPEGFFASLVPALQAAMGGQFPELISRGSTIRGIIAEEETSFGKTLVKGLEVFNKMAAAASSRAGPSAPQPVVLPGSDAFLLWDTFGFPPDLTQLMAEERGMRVDSAAFAAAMEEAKEKSRAAGRKAGERGIQFEAEATAALASRGVRPTADAAKYVWHSDVAATVAALLSPAGFHDSVDADTPGPIGVVLDATSFYAESGGQAADIGRLLPAGDAAGGPPLMAVTGALVAAGYVLHCGPRAAAALTVGAPVLASVDYGARGRVAPNHTMTHVLNHALRAVLGDGVSQRGSLVDGDKLRFDFSHGKPVEAAELARVEALVRAVVAADLPVHAQEVPLAAAKAISGLRAVFGEQYPDPVRVVSVGASVDALLADPGNSAWADASIEFCGGTHLSRTGEAEAFALLSEEGIAKGVRRIVGLTRAAARDAIAAGESLSSQLAAVAALGDAELERELPALKAAVAVAACPAPARAALTETVGELGKRCAAAAKLAAAANREAAVKALGDAAAAAVAAGRGALALRCDVGTDVEALRAAAAAAAAVGVAVAIVSAAAEKFMVYISVPPAAEAAGLDCKAWLAAALAPAAGKGGGGKGGTAQGQSDRMDKLSESLSAAAAFVAGR